MRKIINSATAKYEDELTDNLVLDAVPTVNSFNSVTSDAVARAVAGASGEVPQVTENDNGKVLTAIYDEGGPAVEWGDAPSGLPDDTGASQGDVLTIGSSGPEWATPSAGGGFTMTEIAALERDMNGTASATLTSTLAASGYYLPANSILMLRLLVAADVYVTSPVFVTLGYGDPKVESSFTPIGTATIHPVAAMRRPYSLMFQIGKNDFIIDPGYTELKLRIETGNSEVNLNCLIHGSTGQTSDRTKLYHLH